MNKQELLKRIGSVEQIGGIRDFIFNDGWAKGVRGIEINTGKLRFTIIPDRCMDISHASFKGETISWISKTGVVAPTYYDKDSKNWLRGFFGGLVTTCGLKNIGCAVGEFGLHDRISYVPAAKVSVFSDWVGENYVMKVSGEMRDAVVFGRNLVLKRTITAKLFEDTITIEDTIINESYTNEDISLCYHCNFGYPLIDEGTKIVGVPKEMTSITAPIPGAEEECIELEYTDGKKTVGIENKNFSLYLTYDTQTLPKFILWKFLREGEYAVGFEPRTSNGGGEEIIRNNETVTLNPFEEYKTKLKFELK